MKRLYFYIKQEINRFLLVEEVRTTYSGHVWKLYIRKPSERKLLKMGFKSVNRGYRMKTKKQLSLHVLPSSYGWEVHVDRASKGKHTVSKAQYTEVHINKFLKNYPILWNN